MAKFLDIDNPNVDPTKLVAKANDTKAKDWLLNQGADYGITEDMIGWNNDTKMITLGGDDFMASGENRDGRAWVNNDDIRSAFDTFTSARGMESKKDKYDVSKYGYNPGDVSTKIDSILESILNPGKFSYTAETDPSFQAYKEQYGRAGDKALANTMSEASGLTGGRLNTWAVSAGNQAKANYDEKLMDVIPQLENAAYGRYQDGINNNRNNLNALIGIDNEEFRRATDSRDFDYGMGRDTLSDVRYEDDKTYNRGRDTLSDTRYEDDKTYNRGRDAVEDIRYTDETSYNRSQDADANARAWSNISLSREQFEEQKKMNQFDIDEAAKETGVEPDMFGTFYTEMYSGNIVDENGDVVKTGVTPEEWLRNEAANLPQDVVIKLEEIVRKNKTNGQTYSIIPN